MPSSSGASGEAVRGIMLNSDGGGREYTAAEQVGEQRLTSVKGAYASPFPSWTSGLVAGSPSATEGSSF